MKHPYSSYNTPLPGYGTSLVDRINLYLHFRRYFKLIGERWLLLAICAAAGLGLGFWIAFNKPDVYQAKSVIQLNSRIVTSGKAARYEEDVQQFKETQLALMESSPVLSRVLSKLQEGRSNTNRLAKPELVKASPGKGATYVMTVESTNLAYAQSFASTWAEEFIAYKKTMKNQAFFASQSVTSKQKLEVERQLEADRDALREFQRTHNVVGIKDLGGAEAQRLEQNKEIQSAYLNQISLLENASREDVAKGTFDQKSPESKQGKGRSKEDNDSEEMLTRFEGTTRYAELAADLTRMENLWNQDIRRLKERHPAMVQLKKNIELQQGAIKNSLEEAEKFRKARLAYLKTQVDAYEPLIVAGTAKVQELQSIGQEYDRLLSNERATNLERERLEQLAREVESGAGTDEDTFSVLDPSAGDSIPVRPKRPVIVLSGFVVGSLIGIGILFLLNRLDDRLETPEDIEEQLEEPILGQLPEVEKKHYKEGYLLLTRMKTHTMFAESLRGVRSALLLSPEGTSKRMLAVTSAVPGDGKTTFTTNFAVTLALAGNRTLLVDADLRRGNIHGYFEQPLEGGLSEVLQGKLKLKEAIRETGIENLSFMRAGERPANPSELLIGNGTKNLIQQLRQEFDYVVFDCPPLTAIDDTFSIAAFLDGLFFVVRAGRTSIRFARMGLNTVRQRGAPILGLIVNGVPIDNPYYYYTTYYYASYYHRPLATGETMYPERKRKPMTIELPSDRDRKANLEKEKDEA